LEHPVITIDQEVAKTIPGRTPMARKKPSTRPVRRPAGRWPNHTQTIASLRWYYRLGKRIDRARSRRSIEQMSKHFKVGLNAAYKARSFARKYNHQEFEELCRLGESTDAGISWTHVIQLLSIPDEKRAERRDLQSQSAQHGWSVAELRRRVRARLGPAQKPSGRPYAHLHKPGLALQGLVEVSCAWLRRYEASMQSEPNLLKAIDAQGNRLPKQLRTDATSRLEQLRDAAMHMLEKLKQVEQRGASGAANRPRS
jgi:hypothetical protein